MKIESLFRHLRLLNSPIVFMGCFTPFWYFVFYQRGLQVEGNTAISWGVFFTFITIFHAYFATDTLKKVWQEYVALKEHVRTKNEKEFRKEMYKRIPDAIKFFLFVMTLIVQGMAMAFPFDSPIWGGIAISIVAFVLGMFWEVAVNLDDPVKGIWYKGVVPPAWLIPEPEQT